MTATTPLETIHDALGAGGFDPRRVVDGYMSRCPAHDGDGHSLHVSEGADGRRLGLEIAFKDAGGHTRRRGVQGNIRDARDQLATARARRVQHATEPQDPRRTFGTIADEFEAVHVATLRPNSQGVYRAALTRLRATFGDRRITKITRSDLRRLIASWQKEGLKAHTIAKYLAVLSAVYSFARDDLDISVQMPRLKPSERPRAGEDAREHRILSDDELARLLDATNDRSRLFFRTLAETGARQSEALGLGRRRIDGETITIAEQLARDGTLQPLKGSRRESRRTIEITRSLSAELQLAAGRGRVFDHLDHGRITSAWRAALDHAALADPQPVIHDLRHTHVSGLIADGWDPVEVANRIGDTLQVTLRTYAHEFDARRRSGERQRALEARYGDVRRASS